MSSPLRPPSTPARAGRRPVQRGGSKTRDVGLAALTGLGLLVAAPPDGVPVIVFVALVPLCSVVQRRHASWRRAAALGWLAGALFYAGLIPWLPATVARLQDVSGAQGIAWSALFIAYHAAQFSLAALALRLAAHDRASVDPHRAWRAAHAALLAAGAWIVLEWAYPKVFTWSLGSALGPNRLLRQAADIAGVYGLAAMVVAVNALLAARCAACAAVATAVLVAMTTYGAHRVAADSGAVASGPRIGMVQDGSADGSWQPYAVRSLALAARSDAIVWPESVLRGYAGDAGDLRDSLTRLAARLRRPLVLGALDHGGEGRERNAVFAFTPQMSAVRYKRQLVPFGEYIPAANWLPWLRGWRTTGAFEAGHDGVAPLPFAGSSAALAVCVEAIRPGAFNDQVRAGAGWLLNLTDDSWFASRRAAAQHLEMARLRAVETHRWLVRVSHSGASAIFDARGDLVAALPFGAAGALSHRIAMRRDLTWYVRGGDWPVAAAAVLWAVEIVRQWARRSRHVE